MIVLPGLSSVICCRTCRKIMIHACNPVIWSEQAPMERNRLFFGEKIFFCIFSRKYLVMLHKICYLVTQSVRNAINISQLSFVPINSSIFGKSMSVLQSSAVIVETQTPSNQLSYVLMAPVSILGIIFSRYLTAI